MHSISFSGIVNQGGRSVAECGPAAREMRGVGGLSVYNTHNTDRSACLPIVAVSICCPGTYANDVPTRLDVVSARSFTPYVCAAYDFVQYCG
jgi:hypothetical protein